MTYEWRASQIGECVYVCEYDSVYGYMLWKTAVFENLKNVMFVVFPLKQSRKPLQDRVKYGCCHDLMFAFIFKLSQNVAGFTVLNHSRT